MRSPRQGGGDQVRITHSLPATALEMPSPEQLRKLRAIVVAAHPWLADDSPRAEQAFARSFWSAGMMFRTASPCESEYFQTFVYYANELLAEYNLEAVDGRSFVCAALSHADIPWRKADASIGQLLTVGFNRHSGAKCRNMWKQLLAGKANLLDPTPPPERLARSQLAPRTRFFRRSTDGEMRPVRENESLWG
jgi:hypothetical protein